MANVRAGSTTPIVAIGAFVIVSWPRTRWTVLVTVTATTWPDEVTVTFWATGGGGTQAYDPSTRPPVGGVSLTVQAVPTGTSGVVTASPAARSNGYTRPTPQ